MSKFELIYLVSLTVYGVGPRGFLVELDVENNFVNGLNLVRHWLHTQISNLKLKKLKSWIKVKV